MSVGGSESKQLSTRAQHAARRLLDAVERLERAGIAEHAKIVVVFDGRKVSVFIESASFGATVITETLPESQGVE